MIGRVRWGWEGTRTCNGTHLKGSRKWRRLHKIGAEVETSRQGRDRRAFVFASLTQFPCLTQRAPYTENRTMKIGCCCLCLILLATEVVSFSGILVVGHIFSPTHAGSPVCRCPFVMTGTCSNLTSIGCRFANKLSHMISRTRKKVAKCCA